MTEANKLIGNILGDAMDKKTGLAIGIANLARLPEFDPSGKTPGPLPGKEFDAGVMGIKSTRKELKITVACGKAMVRFIPFDKYVAMIEHMHDAETATIMLQNFSENDENRAARGQILGRINADYSAITIIQGVTGRIIRGPSDIALYDVYYLNKQDMLSFYLACKFQLGNEDQLDSMIAAFDGWKAFSVPLNPLDPYDLGDDV